MSDHACVCLWPPPTVTSAARPTPQAAVSPRTETRAITNRKWTVPASDRRVGDSRHRRTRTRPIQGFTEIQVSPLASSYVGVPGPQECPRRN